MRVRGVDSAICAGGSSAARHAPTCDRGEWPCKGEDDGVITVGRSTPAALDALDAGDEKINVERPSFAVGLA